ncbi:ATP-binding protein [Butyrivibrio sp. INlla16]|uniref:ATP-binding protein n=1 Tax=Butyrivibrio sp. INlla16 TaxID=1520807 RepID=UPI00087FF8D7|nr:ATP-binding protein [Butyrivibrio sp. INlla16]SDB32021.1 PD-(D/E)XK nuclease superfamily protein [Butyrivibrio sp. INlla16]
MERKLPVGIQGFEKLRTDNFLYVDKTKYIYKLAHNNVPYFLSRPRRFGKSLLLSAMKAYWEGKKELFTGLEIEELEKNNEDAWAEYPVFYFDFNGENYNETSIETVLDGMLSDWEEVYGTQYNQRTLGDRFQKVLELAVEKTGRRCVVLIDEYDKPLLDTLDHKELQNHIKDVFKGFFSRLKKADESIHFIFITGVSKFHKVSIFSDLNQLRDISLDRDYAALCGLTGKEIRESFSPEIETLAKYQELTEEECFNALKMNYDGYHFHLSGEGIYNPYSVLSALFAKDFGAYWFETGTPTFLIHQIKERGFDLRKFTNNTIYTNEAALKDYTGDTLDLVPLLYQTGYLTITDYDKVKKRYTLCFPNEEVKYSFIENLMPAYVPKANAGNGLDIFTLDEYIESGKLENIKDFLTALFANITYTIKDDPFEHYFQSVIYLVFTLLGKIVQCEMHTYTGRIDCKVETSDYIYLFEFKRDDSAEAALKQIDTKDYALPFVADSRKLYKIGVSFDSESRKLIGWEVAEKN